MTSELTVSINNGIADVRLNRPEKRNALNNDMLRALRDTATSLAENRKVVVVIISGEGGAFCAGIDLENMAEMGTGDLNADSESVKNTVDNLSSGGANEAQQAAWNWQEIPQPVIAAIDGCAMGVGMDLALGADLRVIHPATKVSFMQIKWGLISDMSATQTLSRLVPLDVAKLLVMTGKTISGQEAYELKLATLLSDDPKAKAMQLAREIAGNNPDAVQAAKKVLNTARVASVADGLRAEGEALQNLIGSDNQIEAVMARLEKRAPQFR